MSAFVVYQLAVGFAFAVSTVIGYRRDSWALVAFGWGLFVGMLFFAALAAVAQLIGAPIG